MSAVSLLDLKAAWLALEAGALASPDGVSLPRPAASSTIWTPSSGEWVLPVIGCGGSVGASTVAVAIATAAEVPARVVECCAPMDSGLAAASVAELGDHAGWRRGSRGQVMLERRLTTDLRVRPSRASVSLTVLDAPASVLLPDAVGWLADAVRRHRPLVLVTRAAIPALRRLEACLSLLDDPFCCIAVVVGPELRRWPKVLGRSLGVRSAELVAAGRVVSFPQDRRLEVAGLTPDPLAGPLIRAGAAVLILAKEPS